MEDELAAGAIAAPGALTLAAPHPPDCTVRPRLDRVDHEIERHLAAGATNRSIAAAVFLSPDGVKKRIARIRRHHRACAAEGLGTRAALAAYLMRAGVRPPA